jgi:hypothetical protein
MGFQDASNGFLEALMLNSESFIITTSKRQAACGSRVEATRTSTRQPFQQLELHSRDVLYVRDVS